MKSYQVEIQEITNSIQNMGSTSNQWEDRLSELKDRAAVSDHLFGDTLKTTRNLCIVMHACNPRILEAKTEDHHKVEACLGYIVNSRL